MGITLAKIIEPEKYLLHAHLPIISNDIELSFIKIQSEDLGGVAFTRLKYQYAIETKFQGAQLLQKSLNRKIFASYTSTQYSYNIDQVS